MTTKRKRSRSPNGTRRINGRTFTMAGRGPRKEMEKLRNHLILSCKYTSWRIVPVRGTASKAIDDYAVFVL